MVGDDIDTRNSHAALRNHDVFSEPDKQDRLETRKLVVDDRRGPTSRIWRGRSDQG